MSRQAPSFIPAPCSHRTHSFSRGSLHQKRRRTAGTPRRSTVRADLGHDAPLRRDQLPEELFRITELQDALDDAIAAEQYTSAAGIRDKLQTAKNEDCVLLLGALLNYYDAFNSHSLERVKRIWRRHSSVICQHPLSACHIGYDAVIESFATLFSTLPADLRIDVSDVRIACFGAAAYITCVETPDSRLLSLGERGKARRHGLVATSVFEKMRVEDTDKYEYLMVHHVSTPVVQGVTFI